MLRVTPDQLRMRGGEIKTESEVQNNVSAQVQSINDKFNNDFNNRQGELTNRETELNDQIQAMHRAKEEFYNSMNDALAKLKAAYEAAVNTNGQIKKMYNQYTSESTQRESAVTQEITKANDSARKCDSVSKQMISEWDGEAATSFAGLNESVLQPSIRKANEQIEEAKASDAKFVKEYGNTFNETDKILQAFSQSIEDMSASINTMKETCDERYGVAEQSLQSINNHVGTFKQGDKNASAAFSEALTTVKTTFDSTSGQLLVVSEKTVAAADNYAAVDAQGKASFAQ